MKKRTINLSWPAQFTDFKSDPVNERFSRAKLKVFFEGETEDHRFFSASFREKIVPSLPYTPVVSYYDEEKQDFVGHATEQQIYGLVDPCKEISYEVDENNLKWCVCEVVLYTERPDKVGEIAKKIVGHKHSLELDPNTVEYKINYDEKKHFKNLEFTAGNFIGLSVLGADQKPAFTGSAFFSCDENFEAKMKMLRDYCENQNTDQIPEGGSQKMNLQDFMKLSWGEISSKVAETISREYANDAYCYVVDMFADSAIVRFFYYVEETSKLMKINYTCDEQGNVALGDINEVRITYEDIVVENSPANYNNAQETEGVEENPSIEKTDDPIVNATEVTTIETTTTTTVPETTETPEVTDDPNANMVSTTERLEGVNGNEQQPEPSQQEEGTTSSAAFTESERAEYESLKREKKVNLLNSYKDFLTEEEYNNFLGSIDSFAFDELELKLLKAYKESEPKVTRAFTYAPFNSDVNENMLDSFIRSNLK